ncbi:MAG: GTP-binding protein [Candidatus Lokiarchaeota archaeon]|nr:GTP-binding protein [Candidatus Lokiarchaeota archaeon]
MIDLNKLNKLLNNLLNVLNQVQAAMIFDNKGNLLTSMMNSALNEEEIGGTTSLISFISDKIKIDYETGLFQSSSLSSENRKFLFRQTDDLILTLICDIDSNIELINPYANFIVNKLSRMVKDFEVDTKVPKLEGEKKKQKKPRNEYAFKILILGNAGVGKTTSTVQFAHSLFKSEYKPTLGVNIVRNEYWIGDDLIHFQIWDLAGQDQWTKLRRIYYSGAQGALLLFDTTRSDSFQDLKRWRDEIKKYTINIPVILVGNKIDLKDLRKISTEKGKEKAEKFGYKYIETSAKTSENIEQAFKLLAKEMID